MSIIQVIFFIISKSGPSFWFAPPGSFLIHRPKPTEYGRNTRSIWYHTHLGFRIAGMWQLESPKICLLFLASLKGLLCFFQYSHLITRRCREHNVYAELMPCTTLIKDVKFKPKGWRFFFSFSLFLRLWCALTYSIRLLGIILSGSPYSVYDDVSPHVDPTVFDLGVPILGICYGLQASIPLIWPFVRKVNPLKRWL